MLPLSEAVKTKLDYAGYVTAGASVFNLIPWANIAAFLTAVWFALRITAFLWDRWKGRRGD